MITRGRIYLKNIYYMLSYAFKDIQNINKDKLNTEEFENIWELFSKIISDAMMSLAKRGLHKEYIETVQEIDGIKGKLKFNESIGFFARSSLKTICTIDEYTEDILFNQIIKSAAVILFKSKKVQKFKNNLKQSLFLFSSIQEINISTVKWEGLNFNRLNNHYKLLINICRMIFTAKILTEEKGNVELPNFISDKDLADLYEKFIFEYYNYHYNKKGLKKSRPHIQWNITSANTLDLNQLPQMRTDIVLKYKDKILIIDAKFYSKIFVKIDRYEKSSDKIRSFHLYQIYTYVNNFDNKENNQISGMLLYAQTLDNSLVLDDKLTPYNIGNNDFYINSLDLNKDFEDIKRQLNLIAIKILQFPENQIDK